MAINKTTPAPLQIALSTINFARSKFLPFRMQDACQLVEEKFVVMFIRRSLKFGSHPRNSSQKFPALEVGLFLLNKVFNFFNLLITHSYLVLSNS